MFKILFFTHRWHLKFIQSEFKGQLPKPYEKGPNATQIIPSHMNDINKEEPTRYVRILLLFIWLKWFYVQDVFNNFFKYFNLVEV